MLKDLLKPKKYARDSFGNKVEVEILPAGWTPEQEEQKKREEELNGYYKKIERLKNRSFGTDVAYALVASVTKLGVFFFFTWLLLFISAGINYLIWNYILHTLTGLASITFMGSYGVCLLWLSLGVNVEEKVKSLSDKRPTSALLEVGYKLEILFTEYILNLFIYLGFGPLGFYIVWDKYLYEFAEISKPGYFVVVLIFLFVRSIFQYLKSLKRKGEENYVEFKKNSKRK